MSDEMVLRCENCNEPNTALDLEMSVYCHKCGRMLPIERYYENLGTADKPSWGRPLWQARIEDAAHAAGAAAEKARVVAVIEAAQSENRTLYTQAIDQQEDARADYRMARIHALADLLGKVSP
jgi:hypothetical protein